MEGAVVLPWIHKLPEEGFRDVECVGTFPARADAANGEEGAPFPEDDREGLNQLATLAPPAQAHHPHRRALRGVRLPLGMEPKVHCRPLLATCCSDRTDKGRALKPPGTRLVASSHLWTSACEISPVAALA